MFLPPDAYGGGSGGEPRKEPSALFYVIFGILLMTAWGFYMVDQTTHKKP